eukprot:UN00358
MDPDNINGYIKSEKHAFVAANTDDLFDDVVEDVYGGFGTDSDVISIGLIQYKDDSNTNIGHVTPPSAQSSEQNWIFIIY